MKNCFIIPALLIIAFTACKGKKKSKEEQPISAISIIKGQLNHLDTTIYEIIKYETVENSTDTAYLKKGEVARFAAPFLSLPDIADTKYNENYDEERLIDAQQQTLNITSTAKNPDAEIQKQIIIVGLADISNAKVQSIFIDRYIASGDSTIEQKLFWEVDKYFTVGDIIQKQNQPDKTRLTRVAWQ